jgi:hypothetical protein
MQTESRRNDIIVEKHSYKKFGQTHGSAPYKELKRYVSMTNNHDYKYICRRHSYRKRSFN